MTAIFWTALVVLAYTYLGYPVVVWVAATLFGREPKRGSATPAISLLIPAYNEELYIEEKIRNSLALDYPRDRLEIVVASDGSTDETNAIVKRFAPQGVKLILMWENIGKSAMISRSVPQLGGELVVFSDVSSHLQSNALRLLVQQFADPGVGCVSGRYQLRRAGDLRGEGEGLYWKYEMFIKRQEARLHSILGAHGAFYAIRRALFVPLERTSINDDYLIPMRIVAQGFRAVMEPAAVCVERELASVRGEFARRRRIAAGNCQQMIELREMLHPRFGWVAFCFFSHKVLRTLAPLFMVVLFLASAWLPQPWNSIMLTGQGVFYASAALGYLCQRRGWPVTWLSPVMYFCLGNLAMLLGLLNYCFSRKPLVWERAR